MNTQKTYSLGPFAVLTFIYFIVGFLTTVNGQFQGPLKVAFLSEAEGLRNTLTTRFRPLLRRQASVVKIVPCPSLWMEPPSSTKG